MSERLKARRVGGGPSPMVVILLAVIVGLLALIVVFLANSPLFDEPTALDLSRQELITALDASPGDPDLLMSLAEVEYELAREREAFEHAEQAVANAGGTPLINMRHAMLLMREGRVAEARSALEAEIALDDSQAEAHFLLGQVLREEGDLEGAIASFERALGVNPTNGDYRLLYADALALAGRDMEATAAYESALAVLPGDERAIQGLARLGVTYVEPTGTVNPHDSGE
ncbi:MAG: tetratricopeptide repeat protein [Coriobacteriia bacterium]|nr:tetratricopeptide repeat protein [Coriobacteriia bacterium]